MTFSPYVKCVCPSCFEEIYLGECKIVSGRVSGKVLKAPSRGILARMSVEPLDGPKYTLELARRECPSCGYLLPHNIELVPSITLAVVGDTFSGKSHYIAALIHQIRTEWMGNTQGFARFTCLTPEVEKYYTKEYFEPLFRDKRILYPTTPALVTKTTADPLIYKLVISPSAKHPRTANLMIYDAAGEDFVHQEKLVQVARFVLNTSAFIFVVNPVAMEPVFRKLSPALQARLQIEFDYARGIRRTKLLGSTIDIFERFHGSASEVRSFNTPAAIMLSKADLLEVLGSSSSYTFMSDPGYGGGLDLQDIGIVDQEVRDLLRKYGQGDLLTVTRRFKQTKFFATSATGEPPDANGTFTKVEPRRCLDPVLWILYCLGVVKAS